MDLNVIIGGAEGVGGIAHGALLADFAECVVGDDGAALEEARSAVIDALGTDALVDACAVAAMFNAIDQVADSTGVPIAEDRLEPTADLCESLGINDFPSGISPAR